MGHKRILGKTTDFITGREITDTDDERYRQKLALFLVEEKGYEKGDIEVKHRLEMAVEGKTVFSMVDFVVKVAGKNLMVIRYGPGSIVTRERPSLATARLIGTYQVPLTVVTNGEDAELLDTDTGEVVVHRVDATADKAADLSPSRTKRQRLSSWTVSPSGSSPWRGSRRKRGSSRLTTGSNTPLNAMTTGAKRISPAVSLQSSSPSSSFLTRQSSSRDVSFRLARPVRHSR